jgi:hypothetical protein
LRRSRSGPVHRGSRWFGVLAVDPTLHPWSQAVLWKTRRRSMDSARRLRGTTTGRCGARGGAPRTVLGANGSSSLRPCTSGCASCAGRRNAAAWRGRYLRHRLHNAQLVQVAPHFRGVLEELPCRRGIARRATPSRTFSKGEWHRLREVRFSRLRPHSRPLLDFASKAGIRSISSSEPTLSGESS